MKTTRPYELLIRWDQLGALQGAHVVWREVFAEGDEIVAERLSDAQPLSVAASAGFPISEVLGTALADALAAVETANAALANKDEELTSLRRLIAAQPPAAGDLITPR